MALLERQTQLKGKEKAWSALEVSTFKIDL